MRLREKVTWLDLYPIRPALSKLCWEEGRLGRRPDESGETCLWRLAAQEINNGFGWTVLAEEARELMSCWEENMGCSYKETHTEVSWFLESIKLNWLGCKYSQGTVQKEQGGDFLTWMNHIQGALCRSLYWRKKGEKKKQTLFILKSSAKKILAMIVRTEWPQLCTYGPSSDHSKKLSFKATYI